MVALALLAFVVGCPRDASLGSVTYVRRGIAHRITLGDCADRPAGKATGTGTPARWPSPDGRYLASIRSTGTGKTAKQAIWIWDRHGGRVRPIFSETEYYTRIGPGDTPGPINLLGWSRDDSWIFFTIDPGSSASIAADGLTLRVVSVRGGRVHKLGVALAYPDYLTWCGGRVVFTAGRDRIAVHAKRLLVAGPPSWRPAPLWNDASRSVGSVACSSDGRSVAVLSQRSSTDARLFSTRWELWRVSLDGSRKRLDDPPAGWADESPTWSPDGRSLLFVRERRGYGRLMIWRAGRVFGPLTSLGYSLGFYGHHEWAVGWLP